MSEATAPDYAKYKPLAQKYLMATAIKIMQQPENLYYGYLLAELKKTQNYRIKAFGIKVTVKGIQLEYNPLFVIRTYEGVSSSALQYMLLIELNHLTLLHMEAAPMLQVHVEGLLDPKALTLLALDNSARGYLSSAPTISCPECAPLKWDESNGQVYGKMLLEMAETGGFSEDGSNACPLCNGCTELFSVTAWANHSGNGEAEVLSQNIYKKTNAVKSLQHMSGSTSEARLHLINYTKAQGLSLPAVDDSVSPAVGHSIARSTVSHVMASKGMSTSGNSLLSAFNEKIQPKAVPYLLRLKGMMSSSMGSIKEQTRYRPNRRFGYKYPGKRATPKMKYIVAVDTSGSVTAKEVAEVISEMLALKSYSSQVECRMLLFHHSVWADMDIEDFDKKDFESKFQSGGTNFDNVFKRVFKGSAEEEKEEDHHLVGHNINAIAEKNAMLVMMTDGYDSIHYPKAEVNGRVVWVLTKGGSKSYIERWDANAEILEMN